MELKKIDEITDYYLQWMNDKEAKKYTTSKFTGWTKDKLEEYTKNPHLYGIYVDRHIGNIKLDIDRVNLRADVGIVLSKGYWNMGLGSRAIGMIERYARFIGVKRLTAEIFSLNTASIKAFIGNDYKVAGIVKDYYTTGDGYCDMIFMLKELK